MHGQEGRNDMLPWKQQSHIKWLKNNNRCRVCWFKLEIIDVIFQYMWACSYTQTYASCHTQKHVHRIKGWACSQRQTVNRLLCSRACTVQNKSCVFPNCSPKSDNTSSKYDGITKSTKAGEDIFFTVAACSHCPANVVFYCIRLVFINSLATRQEEEKSSSDQAANHQQASWL